MNLNINSNSVNNRPHVTEGSGNANISESIKRALVKAGLTEGSVFNGKIQDITGNNIKLLLSGGETLLATLENGTKFNIGESINFFVKSNDGVKILLQPVDASGETGLSQSLVNSLEQLGLEMNNRNIAMVKEMMAYGMALDGSSLSDMERLANAYPNTSVEDIVALNSHGIPVTAENLEQLKSYQSYDHKMTENINNLANKLTRLSEAKPELVKSILDDIMKSLSDVMSKENSFSAANNDNLSTGLPAASAAGGANLENSTAVNTGITAETDIVENTAGKNDNNVVNEAIQEAGNNSSDNQVNGEIRNTVNDGLKQEGAMQLSSEDGKVVVRHNTDTVEGRQGLLPQDESNLIDKEDKGNTGKQVENINSANIQAENLSGGDKLQWQIREAIKELKNRWLLNAEALEGKTGDEIKNTINEKLKTIYASAEKIMEALKNNGMEKTDTYKAAESMKNNIQFMNDFNNVASYVQVPYKTMSGEANGELFVYNRNKNKSLKDGPITAFLHLDMEHLGATDVRVSMDISGKVSTKFSLLDRVSQNIVEEHLPELKKRLEKQGYEVELSSEVIESNEPENPFEQIMKVDRPRNEVKRYGFDIRL